MYDIRCTSVSSYAGVRYSTYIVHRTSYIIKLLLMKYLLLVRHAKSSWDDFSIKDSDRPLNDRGKKDAPMMARRLLKKEIKIFESITGTEVAKSRQHYVRMQLPQTYRLLIAHGISEDHSMGYGSINGFRASVASPFYWYDLERELQTSLLIRPFCYMEANSLFEQHFTSMEAAEELQQYHDVVKSVNGELITVFHNHFVTEQKQWLPWRNMYDEFLKRNYRS